MTKLTKTKVSSIVREVSLWELETTLADLCQTFEHLREQYGDLATLSRSYGDYDDMPHFDIRVEREETDYELAMRQVMYDQQEAYDRLQYKRLKKKFENEAE